MQVTWSATGTRWACRKVIKAIAADPKYGTITAVKLQRIAWRCWHIQFEASLR